MKLTSLIIFLSLLIAAPIAAYIYKSSQKFKVATLTTSTNYQFNPNDFQIEIDKQNNSLTLNKDNASVKIDLDSENLNYFLENWVKVNSDENDKSYLPPSDCSSLEINIAKAGIKKGENIKFNDISCRN